MRIRMGLSIFFHLICCVRAAPKALWEIVDLGAVTDFDDLESYYEMIRTQKSGNPPQEHPNLKKRARIKKKICQNIFSSHHFKANREEWVDVDKQEVRAELRVIYPDIFKTLFQVRGGGLRFSYWHQYEYSNPYQAVEYESDFAFEYVFTCVVKNQLSNELKQYLVTQEYNVNLYRTNSGPIAGRFVLSKYEHTELELEALAEESAVGALFPRRSFFMHFFYVQKRINYLPTETPNSDPICRLSNDHKLRLCASLFAASELKNKLRFYAVAGSIQSDCLKKRISVASWISILSGRFSREDRIFEEWTIGCRAFSRTNGEEHMYYVSQGDAPNTIFVYTEADSIGDDYISLYQYFTNVSVAGVSGNIRWNDHRTRFLANDVED